MNKFLAVVGPAAYEPARPKLTRWPNPDTRQAPFGLSRKGKPMKSFFRAATFLIALFGIGSLPAYAESTEEEFIRLEKEDYAAIIAKDYDKMRLLMADDWVQQDDSDNKITRELMIDRMKSGTFIPESGVFGPMSVKVFGDVVTVLGSVEERFTFAGKPFALHSNFLDVWTKRNGNWVTVLTQMASRDSKK